MIISSSLLSVLVYSFAGISRLPIIWFSSDSSLNRIVSPKISLLEKELFKEPVANTGSFQISQPFPDSTNLMLVKSKSSKKGLTYLLDLSSEGFLVDYFFLPPDSSLKFNSKNALLWRTSDADEFELAVSQGAQFSYCFDSVCSLPGTKLQNLSAYCGDRFGIDRKTSERDFYRQLDKPCGISKYLRSRSICIHSEQINLIGPTQ